MLMAALRDLQWRRRRFVIAILGTAVVFAMTLVLTGLANGFRVEARETVDSLGIDTFIVKSDAAGPFVGSAPFSADQLGVVVQAIGRADAVPLVYSASLAKDGILKTQGHHSPLPKELCNVWVFACDRLQVEFDELYTTVVRFDGSKKRPNL